MANLAGDVEATPSMMKDVDDDTPMGHVSKQIKVGIDGDGISTGSPNRIYDHAKSTTEDLLGRPEMKRQLVTESPSSRVVDDQSDMALQQMAMLCESVKMLGTQMREGFDTEGARREEDHKNLEEKMSARMEEGFKNEQQARQQIHSEIMQEFTNEEHARQLI